MWRGLFSDVTGTETSNGTHTHIRTKGSRSLNLSFLKSQTFVFVVVVGNERQVEKDETCEDLDISTSIYNHDDDDRNGTCWGRHGESVEPGCGNVNDYDHHHHEEQRVQ